MRRYFYLFLLLFSVSLFSQDVNEEIIGKWLIKDISQKFIIGCPRDVISIDELIKPIIKTKLEFTESGLFNCSHPTNQNEFLRFNNSKWIITEEDSIEHQSLEGETLLFLKFREKEVKKYYLSLGGVEFHLERIID